MRGLCVFLVIAAAINASLGVDNKLYVKFGINDPNREHSFYELPRSLNEKVAGDDGVWSIAEERWTTEGVAVACRNNDYRVCLLVDKKLSVAGLQLSAAAEDFSRTNAPIKAQEERRTLLGQEVVSATIYFVSQSLLAAGGRDMTENTPTAPEGFYLKTESGLRVIPDQEEEIAGSKFIKQQCFPGMGRHYFYDLTKDSDCSTIDAFFALYNEQTHKVTGFGYTAYANATVQENGRPWFEYVGGQIVKIIAPNSPECTTDYVNEFGTHSLHVYVSEQPWLLHC